jgi:hypothetical protein
VRLCTDDRAALTATLLVVVKNGIPSCEMLPQWMRGCGSSVITCWRLKMWHEVGVRPAPKKNPLDRRLGKAGEVDLA